MLNGFRRYNSRLYRYTTNNHPRKWHHVYRSVASVSVKNDRFRSRWKYYIYGTCVVPCLVKIRPMRTKKERQIYFLSVSAGVRVRKQGITVPYYNSIIIVIIITNGFLNIVEYYYYFNGTHEIICWSNDVHSLTLIVTVRLLRDSDSMII